MGCIMTEPLSKDILDELKKYKKLSNGNVLCLECGYNGIMGVQKKYPSFLRSGVWTLIFIVSLFLRVVTELNMILCVLFAFSFFIPLLIKLNKDYYFCPQCKTKLKER